MAKEKVIRTKLGKVGDKEYYLNETTGNLEWRIPNVRESIEPEGPEYVLLSADFSQIEVKIMAFMSQDQWLINAINSGKDIHCYNAHDIFGTQLNFTYEDIALVKEIGEDHPRFNELNALRNQIKTTTFGIPYGASAKKVALMTGLTVEEAQELMDRFFAKAFDLKIWLDTQGKNAVKYLFCTDLYGRKRFFVLPGIEDPQRDEILAQIKRWAGNAPIQGSSATMTKLAMVFIYEELRKRKITWEMARILFSLHDEIVMQAHKSIKDEVHDIMKWGMEKAYDILIQGINNKVKVNVDDHWAH